MAGFVENVNKLATDLTPAVVSGIADVVAHGDELETLHNNIADVNAVVDTIIPNMTEILAADTNAAIATAQAGIATAKADEAIAAANTAVLSEATVAYMLDTFDDRYLGQKSTDPVVDNDGNALLVGALYFNSVSNQMRVWDGVAWTDSLTLTASSVSVLTNKTIDAMTNTVGADHVHYKCRNVSGSTIAKGVVVAAQGTQSGTDYIEIVPVTDPQTQIALGVAHVSIANNRTGLVLNTGVEEDRNTSAWTVGTILYPNTTGGFTSTKPTTGRYQACAVVLRSHANHGTLLCEFTEPKYIASTTQAGYVQLNNTLTSTSSTQALTAAQGKELNDRLTTVENGTVQEGDSVTLTGDVTGTATFDANGNVSITTMVVDDSHNHVISNVDGLQTALDGKQPLDTTLTALAGVATSADKLVYATGTDTFSTTILTAAARTLLDDVDVATMRTTLGVSASNTPSTAVGGISSTNVQGALQELDSEKMSTAEYLTAVGTINNPLLHMPLMNDIDLYKGVGTSTFTRASTATYVDRYGVLKTAGLDEPRFEKEGYLNEGSSTNLLTYSERLWDTTYWVVGTTLANFYTVTNETVLASPYGVADSKVAKFVANASTSSIFLRKSSLSIPSGVYTGSIWLYVPTQSGITSFSFFNDYSDTDVSSYVTYTTFDTWVRVSATATLTATRTWLDFNIKPNGVDPLPGFTFYAFGAQLEALPFATSYIPTTSATVTRSADSLYVTRAGNFPNAQSNADGFSVAFDMNSVGQNSATSQYTWSLYTTGTDFIGSTVYGASAIRQSLINSSGSIINAATTTNFKKRRVISTASNSLLKLYIDGVLGDTDTNTTGKLADTANALTSIRIGGLGTATSSNFNGHISNFRIYDKALTAQEVALA